MNPLAVELNQFIQEANPNIINMLSEFGKNIYFPKGILTQSAEAKEKAKNFNATIGIALENGFSMKLNCIDKHFTGMDPSEIYPYAPAAGRVDLRKKWKEKQIKLNPLLKDATFSNPIVTNGITHGLSIVGDMFVDKDDVIVIPDKLWGNYLLNFCVRKGGVVKNFPLYDGEGFNNAAFENTLTELSKTKKKIIVLLNFPNNPTGYSPTREEAVKISESIKKVANNGIDIIVMIDDAYFGLFFEDKVCKESVFSLIANASEHILAIKLDAATKEEYVWGFRCGFFTFATKCSDKSQYEKLYTAIEKKIMGNIRSVVSNAANLSQSLVYKALIDKNYEKEKEEKYNILKARALKVKEVINKEANKIAFEAYPFNSGYFMCIKVKNVNAEKLRLHLLDKYGLGVISIGETDIRIAFSCLEVEEIEEVFDIIRKGIEDLSHK